MCAPVLSGTNQSTEEKVEQILIGGEDAEQLLPCTRSEFFFSMARLLQPGPPAIQASFGMPKASWILSYDHYGELLQLVLFQARPPADLDS